MSAFNEFVYKKVYLIEFKANNQVEYFAFSIPPENEEISHPQRVIETKTFGGVVYDDYGNDVTTINLSGITVNQEERIAVGDIQGNTSVNYQSGQEEIEKLETLIDKYGQQSNLKDKTINLYNLSTGKVWENVNIKSFGYKRNKSSPLAYNYNISFSQFDSPKKNTLLEVDYSQFVPTKIQEIYKNKNLQNVKQQVSQVANAKADLSLLIDNTDSKLDKFKKCVDEYLKDSSNVKTSISNSIGNIKKKLNSVTEQLNNCITVGGEMLGLASPSFWQEIYNEGKDTLESAYRVIFDPPAKFYSLAIDFVIQSNEFCAEMKYDIENNMFAPQNLNPSILGQYIDAQNRLQELQDTANNALMDFEDAVNDLGTAVKIEGEGLEYAVQIGDKDTDDEIIPVYGSTEVTVTDNFTIDGIAKEYYGDSSKASIITTYNHEKETIVPGDKINVPIINETEAIVGNEVYNNDRIKDNYGHDVKIQDSDINFSNNDLSTTNQEETINQSITNRLTTEMDSRIKVDFYGIKSSIGNSQESIMFLKDSIKKTVLQDPRIREVNEITVNGKGDNIVINFTYIDINYKQNTYGGIV